MPQTLALECCQHAHARSERRSGLRTFFLSADLNAEKPKAERESKHAKFARRYYRSLGNMDGTAGETIIEQGMRHLDDVILGLVSGYLGSAKIREFHALSSYSSKVAFLYSEEAFYTLIQVPS